MIAMVFVGENPCSACRPGMRCRDFHLLAAATSGYFLKSIQISVAIRFGEPRLLVELEIQPVVDGQLPTDNHSRIGRCVFRILCIL